LAPGAQHLVEKVADPELPLSERIDPKTPVNCLSVQDWKLVVKAFNEWPFAPKVCELNYRNGT
jgi:transcription factor 1